MSKHPSCEYCGGTIMNDPVQRYSEPKRKTLIYHGKRCFDSDLRDELLREFKRANTKRSSLGVIGG